ncbi:T9SS type A sorting domain-containing protein [Dyadobacter aurulentus]|uniref:T9SS type A sorting domain-containing protein n=1 Tax=Dyadobacter sp. UC 10 TaxID=2605428 RepID=UPI0011F1389F|nr:T9SS type A sorting domain-containing protein [Dyadobacter sp. UC 10]KAA0993496.1 T9SS type A sorting domain-containing protein [Dyadobacter sp. UC 10]
MKNIYTIGCAIMMAICLQFKASAQCSLVDPAIELNSVSDDGGNCKVSINLSFTIDKNNGNKFTYVHLWKPSNYPNISYESKGPKAAQLGSGVLATLAIDTDGAISLLSTYSADPTNVIPLFTGLNINEESLGGNLSRITIDNIQFVVPGACNVLPILKADVWSTQAASANPNIHCYNKGFNLQISDPVISGKINCNEPGGPRTYDLDIITTNPLPFAVTYKLYLDDGVLVDGSNAFSADDELFYTSPVTDLSSSLPIHSKDENYPYEFLEDKRSIWVVLTAPSLPNAIVAELYNGCLITLPVVLSRFTGSLLDNSISLSWSTTEESGSSYFTVERSSDSKEFMQLGKVNAKNNSSGTQRYNFLDENPLSGANYYRLRMVDLDGRYEHSRIIAIDNSAGSLAFELLGNPATSHEIKFLLKNEDASQIRLHDLSGKSIHFSLIKSGNDFMLTPKGSLTSGLYVLSLQRSGAGVVAKKLLVP